MNPTTENLKKQRDTGYYEAYSRHSTVLRNWLIAFGIGVPFLFATNADFANSVNESGQALLVFGFFFGGVILQFLEVFLYKVAMGYQYLGEIDETFVGKKRFKYSEQYSNLTWPVIVFDLGTVVLYGIGTICLMKGILNI
ncbi:hypothetical protein G0Q06_11790 [Puniceicoccales bacterium CK1056]|uniref:Uncharacterized protein n=1 Tax=Oceanipulchritudo coccoides TaxID=2706888 RepID=A0A6B2M465_9BACT|nr:hypothetical protein [Oceanipulchritudo coccoides]NDV63136.1 hypothetical protein [Oceanipulchritudo coccoides]